MPDDVDGSARIRIELDDSGVPAEARALGDRIASAINGQINGIGRSIERQLRTVRINVQVSPDLSRFDAELLAGLRSLGSINVPVVPDVTGFADRVRAELAGLEVSVRIVPDFTGVAARIRAYRPPPLSVPVNPDFDNFDRAMRGLLSLAGSVGRSLRTALTFSVIAGAAVSAAAGVALFVAALAPAAGILAALPAAALGGAAAIGALQLALFGVSDAFQAALGSDEKKFDKALQSLSPHAAAAAKELRRLKPAFDQLKNSVQDALFAPLVGQLTAVAKALGGPVKAGLSGITAQFGIAGRSVAQFLTSTAAVTNLQRVMDATRVSVAALASGITPVVSALVQLGGVVAAAFGPQLGGLLAGTEARLADFLQSAATGGQAVAWVQGALTVFRQLGAFVLQVGGLIGDVFGALSAGGAGGLQVFTQVIVALRQALAPLLPQLTAFAQLASSTLGTVLSDLGASLQSSVGPAVLGALSAALTGLAGAGPQLAAVFTNLGVAVAALGPALPSVTLAVAQLAVSASQLVAALAPAVSLLARLIAPVVNVAAPVLVAGVALFGLVRALKAAQEALLIIRAAWLAVSAAFAVSPIGVVVLAVVGLAAALYLAYKRFEGFRNVVNATGAAIAGGFMAAVQFIIGLPGLVGVGLSALGSAISGAFTAAMSAAATAVTVGLQGIVNEFVALPGLLVAGLIALPGLLLNAFTSAIAFAVIGILAALAGLVFLFTRLPTDIASGLVTLGAIIALAFARGFTAALAATLTFIGQAATFFSSLPGRIASAISALPGRIAAVFRSATSSALGGASSLSSQVVSSLSKLPGRAGSALSSIGSRIGSAISSATGAATRAASGVISAVVRLFSGLPGKILAAIGNIGSQIASKIRSGLPSAVRGLLPGFADGGIITSPIVAQLGEGGRPEVVIPLTKPQRAVQLAEQSGLTALLDRMSGSGKTGPAAAGPGMVNHFTINEAGNGHVTAHRVVSRLATAGGWL